MSAPIRQPTEDTEAFLQYALYRARGRIKAVELMTRTAGLTTALAAWYFVLVLLDHGIGLSDGLRAGLWYVAHGAAAVFLVRGILVPMTRRIGARYAARTIERRHPEFKNSLINWLELHRQGKVPAGVLAALGRQAAQDAAQVRLERDVDQSRLIRVVYAACALVLAACLYSLVAHKSVLTSLGRVVVPWRPIAPPTQTIIAAVEPGDCTIMQGDDVQITAVLSGRKTDQVFLHVAEGDYWDQRPLAPPRDPDGWWSVRLTEVFKSKTYYLTAGDARSPDYRITVVEAPMVTSLTVGYEYPAYTGLAPRTSSEGAVAALEGTDIQITATTNYPPRQGFLEMNDRAYELPMKLIQAPATAPSPTVKASPALVGSFRLKDQRNYMVRFETLQGQLNPRPIKYPIKVIPDEKPKVAIPLPGRDVEVRPDALVWLDIQAEDDYGLKALVLRGVRGDQPLLHEALPLTGPNARQVRLRARLSVRQLGLEPEQSLDYWVEARDNREPASQSSETPRYRITVKPDAPPLEEPKAADLAQNAPADQRPQPDGQAPEPEQPAEDQPEPKASPKTAEKKPDQPATQARQDGRPAQSQPTGDPSRELEREIAQESDLFRKIQEALKRLQQPDASAPQSQPGQSRQPEPASAGEAQQQPAGQSPQGAPDKGPQVAGRQTAPAPKADDEQTATPQPADQTTPPSRTGQPAQGQETPAAGRPEQTPPQAAPSGRDQGTPAEGPSEAQPAGQADRQQATPAGAQEPSPSADRPAAQTDQEQAGQPAGQCAGQQPGQTGATGAGQSTGQSGGQPGDQQQPGQSAGQTSGQSAGQPQGAPSGAQPSGQAAAQQPGQATGQQSGQSTGQAQGQSTTGDQAGRSSHQEPGSSTGQPQAAQPSGPSAGQPGTTAGGQPPGQQPGQTGATGAGQSTGQSGGQPGGQQQPGQQAGQASGQSAGQPQGAPAGAQSSGQAAGQAGAQPSGPSAGQKGTAAGGQPAGQSSGPSAGQQSGQSPSQSAGQPAGPSSGPPSGGSGQTSSPPGGTGGGGRSVAKGDPLTDGNVPPPPAPAGASSLEAAELTLERFKQQLDNKTTREDLLKDLGWTEEEARAFVDKWRQRLDRLRESLEKKVEAGRPSSPGSRLVRPGTGAPGPAGKTPVGPAIPPDRLDRLHQARQTPPPPQLEERWKEYTKDLAETDK